MGANAFFGFGSQQDFKERRGSSAGPIKRPGPARTASTTWTRTRRSCATPTRITRQDARAGRDAGGAAKKQAEAILEVETALAKVSMDKVKHRKPKETYTGERKA